MSGQGEKFFIFTSLQWWSSGSRRQPSDIVSQLSGRWGGGELVFTFYISSVVVKWQPSGSQVVARWQSGGSPVVANIVFVRALSAETYFKYTYVSRYVPAIQGLACMIDQRRYRTILLLPRDHEKTSEIARIEGYLCRSTRPRTPTCNYNIFYINA